MIVIQCDLKILIVESEETVALRFPIQVGADAMGMSSLRKTEHVALIFICGYVSVYSSDARKKAS